MISLRKVVESALVGRTPETSMVEPRGGLSGETGRDGPRPLSAPAFQVLSIPGETPILIYRGCPSPQPSSFSCSAMDTPTLSLEPFPSHLFLPTRSISELEAYVICQRQFDVFLFFAGYLPE